MPDILVIDDSEDIRAVVGRTLAHFGFTTREAADGASAVKMVQQTPPDLILCDVRMPLMDGYKTLAAIRDLPGAANIPFIFLTAAQDKSEMRRGMAAGADDYLTKPFTPDELLEAVTSRLARQTELTCEVYRQADKLRKDVEHLLAREMTVPLDGILNLTTTMMRDSSTLPPERVRAGAQKISESVLRLNELAKSLA